GFDDAVNQIADNPNRCGDPKFSNPKNVDAYSQYEIDCLGKRNDPQPDSYYIVVSATKTIGGRPYCMRRYSYAVVSNVASYFAAVNGDFGVSSPNSINGKVYARNLSFDYDSNPSDPYTITVATAYFTTTIKPDFNPPYGDGTQWNAAVKNKIIV